MEKKSLKELRKEKKMTLTEVAIIISVAPQTIKNWEDGVTKPNIGKLQELASLYNVEIYEILI